MLAGIKDILVIVNKGQLNQFKKILSLNGEIWVKIKYLKQIPQEERDAYSWRKIYNWKMIM